jgi:FAD/FMN-containing dehydrogenase/Fe-S oxidoreductase
MPASDTLIQPEDLRRAVLSRPADWLSAGSRVDAAGLQAELRRQVEGEVRFDDGSRALYAADASNYRQVPIGVVIPQSKEDVVQTIAACRKFGAPVLSRAGGTSIAGECCNVAVVIDWSKYMRGVLELNAAQRWARVLPGTLCDELRDAAMRETNRQFTWGPDPATHDHCCFGGMIGNNSCGAHAQMSGKTDQNIEALEVLLYDGTRMNVGWMHESEWDAYLRRPGREGDIYRYLRSLRDHYAQLIQKNYTPIPRRVSGYNLDQLLPDADGRFNIARSLVGSEGTLVTVLEAKCRLVPARAERVILMLGYPDVYLAADHVVELNQFNPTALEGIDDRLHYYCRKKGGILGDYLRLLPEGNGWLMVEFGAETQDEALETAHRAIAMLPGGPAAPHMQLFTDTREMQALWKLRESALGATAFVPGEPPTWPGWEDSAVAPENLGRYLRELRTLFARYDYVPAIYGHFGHACIHCRVNFDIQSRPGIAKWRAFLDEATDLCVKYNGSLSGEHGDGQARGEFLYKMFGPELIQAFREFKSIWDPDWKMNPGKVIDAYRVDENLRLGADYQPWKPATHFRYPQDGGSFAQATLRCVGVGKCRRHDGTNPGDDTLCPSFMATHEERHSPRGRAHTLWEMVKGEVLQNGWKDEAVKETLELCLSCKGCKSECPVNVDVATYKAEFLAHYWEGRVRPRYAYAFGLIDLWSRVASLAPGFANLFTQLPILSAISKKLVGIPPQRRIPAFAARSFKAWFRKRGVRNPDGPPVTLWADTFNNYYTPETAKAAVEVLEHYGYRVQVPRQHLCCGRPLYDHGFLGLARRYLNHILHVMGDGIDAGTPMVVLEPSCCSVFRDELHGLMPDSARAHKLMENTFTLAEFLEKKVKDYPAPQLPRQAIVQGHCHHKAIMRFHDDEAVMQKIGLSAQVLDSGCCGMAGAFGYEADKYATSIACGERKLLPKVRKAKPATIVMADGFSCKSQIEQQTPRHALHLAEVVAMALHEGAPAEYPERALVEPRLEAQKKSMHRAGLATAAALAGGGLLWWLVRRRT